MYQWKHVSFERTQSPDSKKWSMTY